MKKIIICGIVMAILFIVFDNILPGTNPLENVPDGKSVAGFWTGLLHGFMGIPDLIASFFRRHLNFYEVHNSGRGYNLGFILGIIIFFMTVEILTEGKKTTTG